MADEGKTWAPLAEVAAAYGVSIDTIRRRMRRGEIEGRREQTPQGFRWLAPLPETVERNAVPDAPGSPERGESAAHELAIIQRERDELIETLRHELAIRNREITRLHEVIASQAAALQAQAPALAARAGPASGTGDPAPTAAPAEQIRPAASTVEPSAPRPWWRRLLGLDAGGR